MKRIVGYAAMALLAVSCSRPSLDTAKPTKPADPAKSGEWLEDFAAAKAKAKETGRPILADFSGSDWCGWCIKLDKEVFSQADFKAYAKDNLVLFLADYPQRTAQAAKVKKQNEVLQAQYQIQGFPTVLLLDAEGKVLQQTGYQEGGASAYVQHLKDLLTKAGWKPPEKPAAATNAPAYKPAPVFPKPAKK